jgi:hypothetical protein
MVFGEQVPQMPITLSPTGTAYFHVRVADARW